MTTLFGFVKRGVFISDYFFNVGLLANLIVLCHYSPISQCHITRPLSHKVTVLTAQEMLQSLWLLLSLPRSHQPTVLPPFFSFRAHWPRPFPNPYSYSFCSSQAGLLHVLCLFTHHVVTFSLRAGNTDFPVPIHRESSVCCDTCWSGTSDTREKSDREAKRGTT